MRRSIAFCGTLVTFLALASVPGRASTSFTSESLGIAAFHPKIEIDSHGRTHLAYKRIDGGTARVGYSYQTACSWVHEEVDVELGNSPGDWISLALDGEAEPHISCRGGGVGGPLVYITQVDGTWVAETVDAAVNARTTSIALDSQGEPRIAYAEVTNASLKYAERVDGEWLVETVDTSTNVISHPSLAFDTNGDPHIAYAHSDVPGTQVVKYAIRTNGAWTLEVVSPNPAVNEGNGACFRLDSFDRPHITYENSTNTEMHYATKVGGVWTIEVVHNYNLPHGYTSLRLDSMDRQHVCYYARLGGGAQGNLTYALRDGGAWTVQLVTQPVTTWVWSALALDPLDDPRIIYPTGSGAILEHLTGLCSDDHECVPPPKDMIAWWPLDEETTGSASDLVFANHCAWLGNPSQVDEAYVEHALCFPLDTDYLETTSNDPRLQLDGDFSIDAWIQTSDGALRERTIVSKRPNCTSGYRLFLSADGALGFAGGGIPDAVSAAPLLFDGGWHHVAVSVDRSDASGGILYVDGSPVHTFDPTDLNSVSSGSFRIGADGPCGQPAAFGGRIDEVELFDAAKSPAELASIHGAHCRGKCKETCSVPPFVSRCSSQTTVTTNLVICNYAPAGESRTWQIEGIADCDVDASSLVFDPASGTELLGGTEPCVNIPITITIPAGLLTGSQVACYRATIDETASGAETTCDGSIRNIPNTLCWRRATDFASLPVATAVPVRFDVVNDGAVGTQATYRLVATPSGTGEENVVRLNGLAPGVPVEGSTWVAAGDTAEVSVGVAFQDHDPFAVHTIALESDTGVGITSTLVRSSIALAVGVGPQLAPSIEGMDIEVFPNPFDGGATIRFSSSTTQWVRLRVIDVAGRNVRSLLAKTVEAGSRTTIWDGRDNTGSVVSDGIYFLRVEAATGAVTKKIVRLSR